MFNEKLIKIIINIVVKTQHGSRNVELLNSL